MYVFGNGESRASVNIDKLEVLKLDATLFGETILLTI